MKYVPKPDLRITIDGHRIDLTDYTKILGVVIDCKLNWKKHISSTVKPVFNDHLYNKIYYQWFYTHYEGWESTWLYF